MPARFVFAPPLDWVTTEVAPPPLREGSDVALDRWLAWRAPDDATTGARAVSACFGVDLPTWVDEATPVALERLDATATTVSLALDPATAAGLREVGELRTRAIAEQELARVGDGAARVVARTALGFASRPGAPRLEGCFVLCAPTSAACERSVSDATLVGFAPPPPASALASAVAYGVHHPRVVATSVVALFLLAGTVAVWTRPRPRARARALAAGATGATAAAPEPARK